MFAFLLLSYLSDTTMIKIYDVSASAGSAKFYPSGEKSTQDAIPSEQLVVVSKLHPKQSWNGIAKDFLFAESLGTSEIHLFLNKKTLYTDDNDSKCP